MTKILANDGIDSVGKELLEQAGFTLITEKVDQDKLIETINKEKYEGIIVRSATKVRKDLIDACPSIKLIARGGVGMDNIDVEYAQSKDIEVINTPAASSLSVAELVFAHLFSISRSLHQSNRVMPLNGSTEFAKLKKDFAKGAELRGKNIGIIGFGRIGQAVAKYALGLGMKVFAYDPRKKEVNIQLTIQGADPLNIKINIYSFDEVLKNADYITLHVPGGEVISKKEFEKMKDGISIINTSRGGAVNEEALLAALKSGKIAYAGLDVFNNEPTPDERLLQHQNISLSPHIGAATNEAQLRIGKELAEKIITYFKVKISA